MAVLNSVADRTLAVILHNMIAEDAPEDMKDVLEHVEWISDELAGLGFDVRQLPFSVDSMGILKEIKYEYPSCFVFNLMDMTEGEESLFYLAVSYLDSLCLPYTGSSLEAAVITTNKVIAKKLMVSHGIPTPAWYTAIGTEEFPGIGTYIIKPLCEDASVDIEQDSIIHTAKQSQLDEIIKSLGKKRGKHFYAEKYIEGREFNVSVTGGRNGVVVEPPAEVIFGSRDDGQKRIYSYSAKWLDDTREFENVDISFSGIDEKLASELRDYTKKSWDVFGLNGYAKVDFRVDGDGMIHMLEVNMNPSLYMLSNSLRYRHADFKVALRRIVDEARYNNRSGNGNMYVPWKSGNPAQPDNCRVRKR